MKMDNIVLSINKTVPATIFEEKEIKNKIQDLFQQNNDSIKKRYNEIKNVFEQKEIRSINYTTIRDLFKGYFLKKVVNEAVELLFEDGPIDSLSKAICHCLTYDSLWESMYGKEMLDAFKKAIKTLPDPATFIRGQAIVLLKKRFSGFNPYSRDLPKVNYCNECGCRCRCDGNCGGDIKKCTSPRAKNCNHHCDCWIVPLAVKIREKEGNIVIPTKKKD